MYIKTIFHSRSSHFSLGSDCTVIQQLRSWFPDVGVPTVLCTDRGPQLSSRKFADFCHRWQIQHIMSSPHYPQSNGHAKAAVKAMKILIMKTTQNGEMNVESFQRGLLELRNTPSSGGHSPAQKLFGKPSPSFLLAHHRSFAPSRQSKADEADAAHRQNVTASPDTTGSARHLSSLSLGTHVDVQDPRTKL